MSAANDVLNLAAEAADRNLLDGKVGDAEALLTTFLSAHSRREKILREGGQFIVSEDGKRTSLWRRDSDLFDAFILVQRKGDSTLAAEFEEFAKSEDYNDFQKDRKAAAVRRDTAERNKRRRQAERSGAYFKIGDHLEVAQALKREYRKIDGADSVTVADTTYRYRTGCWRPLTIGDLRKDIIDFFEGAVVGEKLKPLLVTDGSLSGIVNISQDLTRDEEFFDHAARGVAFPNGFYRLGADRLEPHSPENRARTAFEFEYDETAKARRFHEYVSTVIALEGFGPSDAEARKRLLQEVIGCAIFGLSTRYQKMIFVSGPPGTGKSTLVEVIRRTVPEEARTSVSPQDFDNHELLSQLVGARLNTVLELPRDAIHSQERLKEVADGATITISAKYAKAVQFRPEALHVYAGNYPPRVPNAGLDFWDRFIVFPMKKRFRYEEDEEHQLAEAIVQDELAGVIAWAIEGAHRLLRQGGFTVPESSVKALDKWKGEADPVAMFVQRILEDDGRQYATFVGENKNKYEFCGLRDTYDAFCRWASAEGIEREGINRSTFRDRIETAGVESDLSEGIRRYALIKRGGTPW